MKTSNYILSAFFIFVTISIFALFISARNYSSEYIFINKQYDLDNINVIIAEDLTINIYIQTSDKNYLSVNFPKNEPEPEDFYRVSNDTLFIYDLAYQNRIITANNDIYVKNISSIVAKNSQVIHFRNFYSDKLYINTTNSNINFNKSSIKESFIQADKSHISVHETVLTSLIAELSNKSVFSGKLKDTNKINLKKDQNSRITVY